MSNPYVGEIRVVGFNFVPLNWHACDGSLLPISENETLFTLLGTTFGGDGMSTFAVPDLRGRVPVHQGQGPGTSNYLPGQLGGLPSVTLTTQNLPPHTHPMAAQKNSGAGVSTPDGNFVAPSAQSVYNNTNPAVGAMTSIVSPAGSSQSHDNMQPYLGMQYVISLYGTFPSQQ